MTIPRSIRIASTWLLVGSVAGCIGGAIGGAKMAASRDAEDCVSRAAYRGAVERAENIALLYTEERKLNVDLTHNHVVARRLYERPRQHRRGRP